MTGTEKVDTTAVEAMGFEVAVIEQGGKTHYELTGERGARYGFLRHGDRLIATNLRNLSVVKIGGFVRFTDEGAVLRPVS